MEVFVEMFKISVPALVVGAITWLMLKRFFDAEMVKRREEARMAAQQHIFSVRLQAYERMVLYLERINPNSLIMRVYKNGMSGRLLHAELLRNIREEYEQHLSQQVYISSGSWELIKNAKEETVKLVNIAAQHVETEGDGLQLSTHIIRVADKTGKLPTQVAIDFIKKEIRKLF